MPDKPNVLVLAGGTSGEREISLMTARAVTESLIRTGFGTKVIDTADGRSLLDDKGDFISIRHDSEPDSGQPQYEDSIIVSRAIESGEFRSIDVVFIALHGGSGEDGTLQSILDLAKVPYTGSGMLASALAMNKAMTKKLAHSENIRTPKWKAVDKGKGISSQADTLLGDFEMPFIVKPNNSGSTVGLTLVKNIDQLRPALDKACKEGAQALVESFIAGRELTCTVLEGRPLPLVEIVSSNELYDYEAKYTKGKSQYICPADIDKDAAREISEGAAKMYDLIGCRGLIRTDFILDNENKPWFLEVNTIPGMTELSLAPMAARAVGIGFDELIEQLCMTALKKDNGEDS